MKQAKKLVLTMWAALTTVFAMPLRLSAAALSTGSTGSVDGPAVVFVTGTLSSNVVILLLLIIGLIVLLAGILVFMFRHK